MPRVRTFSPLISLPWLSGLLLGLWLLWMALYAPRSLAAVPPAAPPVPAVQDSTEAPDAERTLSLDVGGALRYNFIYRDWQDASRAKAGDLAFDTFRIEAQGSYGRVLFAAEYRFYSGYHMLKTGWVGYRLSDALEARVGVTQVPFGITTYASHSWFFQIPYYLGLEDDHDAGVKVQYERGPLSLAAAFFKNAEGPFTGSSLASARYSYDVVPAAEGALDYGPAPVGTARFNEETNQGNLKLAYRFTHGTARHTEIGTSAQYGQLYNRSTRASGTHWAAALHANGTYGRVNVKLEWIRYAHHPHNPPGQEDRFIVMGAYDAPYKVARDGTIYVAGVRYEQPLAWGPVASVSVYNDYSYLDKAPENYIDTQQNITGAMVAAGPVYVYVDLVYARNHPFAVPGRDFSAALAEGTPDWHARFNVNIGYYF